MGTFVTTRSGTRNAALPADIDEIETDGTFGDPFNGLRDLETRSVFSERWLGMSEADLEGRRARNENLRLLDERCVQWHWHDCLCNLSTEEKDSHVPVSVDQLTKSCACWPLARDPWFGSSPQMFCSHFGSTAVAMSMYADCTPREN